MADGQESSTRYITMDAANVPSAEELGVPADLALRWRDVLARSFAAYHAEYARLDALATAEPQRVRVPAEAKPRGRDAAAQELRPRSGALLYPLRHAHQPRSRPVLAHVGGRR
jgi:hypothetical protein